jgi:hypothetical protein
MRRSGPMHLEVAIGIRFGSGIGSRSIAHGTTRLLSGVETKEVPIEGTWLIIQG